MSGLDDAQVLEVMRVLGKLDERTERIDKILSGNGQMGLIQKVEQLEAHKNKVTGAVTILGFVGTTIWGALEYFFHSKGGK
jgi:hypothetical protein